MISIDNPEGKGFQPTRMMTWDRGIFNPLPSTCLKGKELILLPGMIIHNVCPGVSYELGGDFLG